MNRLTTPCAFILLAFGATVYAEEAPTRSGMTDQQAMKVCLERQKTVGVSMSKAAMQQLCEDKLKQEKATGEMPEQPATDAPHNP